MSAKPETDADRAGRWAHLRGTLDRETDVVRAALWAHLRGSVAHTSDPDLHPHPDSLTLAHHVLMFLRDFAPTKEPHLPNITLLADALEEAFWQAERLVQAGQSVTLQGLTVVEPPRPTPPPIVGAPAIRGLRQEIASAYASLLGLLLAAQRIAGLAEWQLRELGAEVTRVADSAEQTQVVLEARP